jgi:hypothetical protein
MKRPAELPDCAPSKLKLLVVANLRQPEEHRISALLQKYFDRWGELTAAERANVFRVEAASEDQARPASDQSRGEE